MLLADWRRRFGGREHLRGDELHELHELVAAYTPTDFVPRISTASRATVAGSGISVVYRAEIFPPDQDPDDPKSIHGVVDRMFQTIQGKVRHEEFRLPLPWQARGLGTDCVRRSVELYDMLDLRSVSLQAASQGVYVWAMCGFDFLYPGVRLRAVQGAQSFANRLPLQRPLDFAHVRFPWEIASEEEPVTYRDIAEARGDFVEEDDLDADEGVEEIAVGKAIMLSGAVPSWEGRLDLDPNTFGRRMFDLYAGANA